MVGHPRGARESPRHGISCELSEMMPAFLLLHGMRQLAREIPDTGEGTVAEASRRQLNVIRCNGEQQHQNVLACHLSGLLRRCGSVWIGTPIIHGDVVPLHECVGQLRVDPPVVSPLLRIGHAVVLQRREGGLYLAAPALAM